MTNKFANCKLPERHYDPQMTPLKAQAIQTALTGDWNSAITLNQMILQDDPQDIDTLNRLAFAHASLGNVKEAKHLYQKVLNLDNQNPIALRNLKRIGGATGKKPMNGMPPIAMNNIFIEEPGKTKMIEVINLAEQKILSQLHSGEELQIVVKRMKIFLLSGEKQYIGMLPDDISKRLIKFMNGGNKYEAYVKNADNHKLHVFVKETKRSLRFKNQPSFGSGEKSKLLIDSNSHLKANGKRIDQDDDDDDKSDPDDSEEF